MQQTFRSLVRGASALLAAAAGLAHAAQPMTQQDTAGAISNYDILGVKLGMPEADAIAAIKKRFPAGTKDGMGNAINLKQSDYMMSHPVTRQPVRAGVRFDLHPEQKTNFDFVKIFTVNGKVWAIWRDEASSVYDYDKTSADIKAKYPGAAPFEDYYDVVQNNKRTAETGWNGQYLVQGKCSKPPLWAAGSDSMTLEPSCNKILWMMYAVRKTEGVKTIGAGKTQLVDVDAGRQFFALMRGEAASAAAADAKRGGDAKL
jgi:hypothetical protein